MDKVPCKKKRGIISNGTKIILQHLIPKSERALLSWEIKSQLQPSLHGMGTVIAIQFHPKNTPSFSLHKNPSPPSRLFALRSPAPVVLPAERALKECHSHLSLNRAVQFTRHSVNRVTESLHSRQRRRCWWWKRVSSLPRRHQTPKPISIVREQCMSPKLSSINKLKNSNLNQDCQTTKTKTQEQEEEEEEEERDVAQYYIEPAIAPE